MDYKSRRWRAKRQRILRRDKNQCCECKRYGLRVNASIVHHVFPAGDYPGLAWEDWNLISLCPACHNAMHVRDTEELTAKGLAWCRRVPPFPLPPPIFEPREPGGRTSSDGGKTGGGG